MREYTIIGITGQTGAGKSSITQYAQSIGCHIIDADLTARKILEKGSVCLDCLSVAFGNDIVHSDGTLDRKLLAKRAFSSFENTDKLNSITHPFIFAETIRMIDSIRNIKKDAVIILDAPTLFESRIDVICDYVIAVICPESIRRERIIKRDGLSEADADIRLKAQKDDSFYIGKSDFILNGADNPDKLHMKLKDIILETAGHREVNKC